MVSPIKVWEGEKIMNTAVHVILGIHLKEHLHPNTIEPLNIITRMMMPL